MTNIVQGNRPSAACQQVGFQRPVRSFDWTGAGALANYLLGRGSVLVPQTEINETIAAGPNTRTYRFRVFTNPFPRQRAYLLELVSGTAGGLITASVNPNGAGATSVTVGTDYSTIQPAVFYEDIHSSTTQAEAEITIAVSSTAGAAVTVLSAMVIEMPVPEVPNGTDLGYLAPTASIDVSGAGRVPLNSGGSQYGAINAARRAGMFHYCAGGSEGNGVTGTNTAYTAIYTAACEQPCLGRFLYSTDTTRSLAWKAYGKIAGGATLSVRITMTSGDVQVITTTSAAGTWFGGPGTLAVDAEDLSAIDGRRSTRDDLALIEVKTSDAAKAYNLYTVSGWEPLAI